MADHTAYRGVILVCDHGDVVLAAGALDLVDEQRMRGRQFLAGLPFLHGLVEDIGDDMLLDLAGSGRRGRCLLDRVETMSSLRNLVYVWLGTTRGHLTLGNVPQCLQWSFGTEMRTLVRIDMMGEES